MGCASCFSHSSPFNGVFIEYTRGIHMVFTGYTYVSGMYRVCIAYVSGKHRKIQGAERVLRDTERGEITISYAQSARNLNYLNYKRIIIYNNLNNINQQHIALATTQRALRGIGRPLNCTERHGNQKDLVSLRKRRNNRSTKGR